MVEGRESWVGDAAEKMFKIKRPLARASQTTTYDSRPTAYNRRMLLAEFSIWPMDKGVSVGAYVARALDIVDRSGLAYKVGPLGTCVEGEYEAVMEVVRQCHEALAADSDRVMCTIKMDWRKGRSGRIEGKVASVEASLGRPLKR